MGTAIVAAASSTAFALSATGVVIASVINLAISYVLGKVLAPDAPRSGRGNRGLTSTARNPISPRRVLYGEAVTGGPFVYLETSNNSAQQGNELLHMIICMTSHPVEDILGVFIDDEYIDISLPGLNDLDGNYFITGGRFAPAKFSDLAKVIKVNGWAWADINYVTDENSSWALPDRARSDLIADFATGWDSQELGGTVRDGTTGLWTGGGQFGNFDKLTNCAHIYFRLEYHPDAWTGIPRLKFHVKGKRLYNPALDPALVAYGADSAGTHDLTDPDTWEWSDDWTLCVLDYLLNTDYGLGALASTTDPTNTLVNEIDWAEAISSYNISSAQITTGLTSPLDTESTYTINGVFEVSSTPISIMESLLTSGAGELIYSQGLYKIRPGAYRAPSSDLDIINEDMIVSPLTIQTHTPRADLFNKAAGVYTEPGYDNTVAVSTSNRPLFEASDFPIVSPLDSSGSNPYEVIDGEEIIEDFDFPFVTSATVAQRLARIQLERIRRGLTLEFDTTLETLKYSVGDTVYVEILNDSKYNNEAFFNRLGLDDTAQDRPFSPMTPYYKQFKIVSMTYNENFTINMILVEESKFVYDWNDGDANPIDPTLVSELLIDDPVGTVEPPSWVVSSPNQTVVEVVVGTDIRTQLYWTPADRGSVFNQIDKSHIFSYRIQYGIVTNPSAAGETRVDTWIPLANFPVEDRSLTVQGPVALTNIYIDPDTDYEFRIKSVTDTGRASDWAYYSDDIGTYFSPSVPFGTTRYYIRETNGIAIQNGVGTLTIEARAVTSAGDSLLSSGTIKLYESTSPYNEITTANGYTSPSDGYTGTFDATDINGSIVILLSDGSPPGGTLYDSTTLLDVTDGTGQAVRQVTIFRLNSTTISSSSGTFADPLAGNPSWSYSVPTLTNDGDYTSSATRQFTSDGLYPQDANWSTPTTYSLRTDGVDGLTGQRARTVSIFRKNSSSINSTSGTFADPLAGNTSWSYSVPSITVDTDIVYIAVRTFTDDAASPQDSNWSTPAIYAQRTDGSDGFTSYLTNEAFVTPADADGTNYSYTNSGGTHKLFEGTTDRTTSAVHSIVGGTDGGANWTKVQNNLTLTLVEATGVYSLSGASWNSNSESFTLRATYGGVDYDKVYTIVKALGGAAGGGRIIPVGATAFNADATSAEVAFRVDSDGDVYRRVGTGGSYVSQGTYLGTGVVGDYDCMLQVSQGEDQPTSGTAVNEWFACASDRTWILTRGTNGTFITNATVFWRDDTTFEVLGSAPVYLEVENT